VRAVQGAHLMCSVDLVIRRSEIHEVWAALTAERA
jgi:hypothetical protein